MNAIRRRLRQILLLALLVAACPRFAAAGPFTDLIVFGDSLSDIGNIAQSSFDIYPGPHYYNDRFSNGAVWVESLSTGLGLGTLGRSTAGGDDFAYGGAKTTGTGGLEGLFIRDVDEQVTQFLNTRTVDAGALFVVFAGSNDLIDGQTNVNVPTARLTTDLNRLIAAGARRFLVPNLPRLGFTPRFNGSPSSMATYNQRTEQLNAAVDVSLANLASANAALTFYRLDVAALFAEAISQPALFGLTNVAAAAAPGLTPGTGSYDSSQIAPNAHEYLFWDDLHPTATVHTVLAQRALALVDGLAGDFNADDLVDGADLAAWSVGFGTTGGGRSHGDADQDGDSDGADLLVWQRQLGVARPGAAAAIPEPATLALVATAAGGLMRRQRLQAHPGSIRRGVDPRMPGDKRR